MRAAQFGSHQFQRPRRATAAGVRTPRMMVASIRATEVVRFLG
jgi:hypothetical protein